MKYEDSVLRCGWSCPYQFHMKYSIGTEIKHEKILSTIRCKLYPSLTTVIQQDDAICKLHVGCSFHLKFINEKNLNYQACFQTQLFHEHGPFMHSILLINQLQTICIFFQASPILCINFTLRHMGRMFIF